MGQLILTKPGILELRLLKGNPLQPGLVPPAGHNAARREYWTNPPLFEWPAASVQADPFKFLLIWNYLDPTSRLEGFTLHIAHPISPGNYGSPVPCDLVEAVPRGGTFFEELRPFRHDEDEDLFIQVADEEQQ